jgi:quercetin dioxygenase-like cupin family protein
MTIRTFIALTLAFALGAVFGALGNQAAGSDNSAISRTPLIDADLVEFEGKEVRMYTVEIAPGAMTPRHRHPGHYLTYILKGTGVVQEDGKPDLELRPGVTYYYHPAADKPPTWHTVWNTSKTEPLVSLSVLITDKGKPGTIYDK